NLLINQMILTDISLSYCMYRIVVGFFIFSFRVPSSSSSSSLRKWWAGWLCLGSVFCLFTRHEDFFFVPDARHLVSCDEKNFEFSLKKSNSFCPTDGTKCNNHEMNQNDYFNQSDHQ
ncbi:hypothetical protein DERF_014125, partial [Dermatophagoides farinae]